ncbi:hypothetical protein EGW08_005008 [Elysia chlorotica]|uniref:Uncharacterized protein n=1 Tax=Elysia chlorotica TaxID=188477 RepID=A0A433U0B3_ELYCH|nr:hypothetical protein EGW08_005008 [Elysia chlorotica]
MVVVSGLTAMPHHNPRPRQTAGAAAINAHVHTSSFGGGGVGEGYHLHSKRRPPAASNNNNSSSGSGTTTLIDIGPGCSSSSGSDYEGGGTMDFVNPHLSRPYNHDLLRRSQEPPGFFYNGEQNSGDETQQDGSFENTKMNVRTPRRTSLDHFFSSPLSTPSPSSSPSSSPRKSASFTSKNSNNFLNKNGILSNHVKDPTRSTAQRKNGMKDNSRDYVFLSQNWGDPRQTAREDKSSYDLSTDNDLRASSSSSPANGGVSLLAQYPDSCLIDAGEHQVRASVGSHSLKIKEELVESISPRNSESTYPVTQNITLQSSNGRKKPPKLSGAGPLFHTEKRGSSFGDSEHNLSASTFGNVRHSLPSSSLDSPFASTSRLDTWGPSYVTASFFMSNSAAADPIHHPVPRRGIPDGVRRSHSSGLFASVSSPSPQRVVTSDINGGNSTTMSGTVGGSGGVTSSSQYAQLSQHHHHQHSHNHHQRPRSSSNEMFMVSKSKHPSFVQHQSPLAAANRLHSSTRDLSSINRDAASLVAGKYDTGSLRSVKMIHISKDEDSVSVKSFNVTHSNNLAAPTLGRDELSYGEYASTSTQQNNSQYYSTLPRKGSHGQYLRRTLSHDPRAGEVSVKPSSVVVRTVSDGEIESDYVTLDRSYVPSSTSRLCRVIEDIPTAPHTSQTPPIKTLLSPTSQSPSSMRLGHLDNFASSKHVNYSRRKNISHGSDSGESNGDASPTSINTINLNPHLVNSNNSLNRSMNTSQSITNTNNRKSLSTKKKYGPGPLRAMAESLGSVFTHKASSDTESPSRQSSIDTPLSSFDLSSPTSPISPLAMSVNYGTMLRSGSSRTKDQAQPQSGRMTRSKSLPDLQKDAKDASDAKDDSGSGDNAGKNYSDDEDGDEFGFLSYPISFSSSCASAVMNKAKSSPSPGARIFPKRWRSKSKTASTGAPDPAAMWTPGPPVSTHM